MKLSVNVPQSQFLNLTNKYRAYVAGYGAGKTFIGCVAQCLDFWKYPGINQAYFAPTFPQIRDIYYPTVQSCADLCGLTVEIREGNKEVHFYNGRTYRGTVICRSMQLPQTIVGFKIGNALVDEIDVMDTNKASLAWNKIIGRLRWENAPNRVSVTTTPEGYKFIYQRFVMDKTDNYGLIQASTYDNEANLPDGYIESLADTYNPELRAAYLNGQFVNLFSGTVFRSYERKRCASRETVQPREMLRIGCDFNVTNVSAVVYVTRGGIWHAVDEMTGIYDTPDLIAAIKQKYPDHSIRIYPDASGGSRKTVDASISDISLLQSAGLAVYAHKSNPLVKDRVIAANVAFDKGMVKVNELLCPEYSRCLEQLAYDANGAPDKKSNLDHLPDAGTYPIAYEMPVVKPAASVSINFVS
ncbi:putative terminase [uncultured Mediterranean phage uvMED]|nr:putative terminase [uncultured Mediterranean phage uvMED]